MKTFSHYLQNLPEENKLDKLSALFGELSSTCKSCHRSYKN